MSARPLPAAARAALYFESAASAPANARRILLIQYNFPPDPAVGGLRWQQMATYFAEQGWVVDVVARDFSRVEGIDTARLDRLPPGTRVFSVPDREPVVARIQRLVWRPIRRVVGHMKTPVKAYALSQPEIQKQRGWRTKLRAYLAWMEVARGQELGTRGSQAGHRACAG